MKKILLNFNGYWTDPSSSALPTSSGIYCTYRGNDNVQTVTINQLLYIGEAENIRNRVIGHEKRSDWKRYLKPGETLIFSAAPIIPATDRFQAEAALINYHKPPVNIEYNNSFPFDDTEVWAFGQTAGLASEFIVTGVGFLDSLFNIRSSVLGR